MSLILKCEGNISMVFPGPRIKPDIGVSESKIGEQSQLLLAHFNIWLNYNLICIYIYKYIYKKKRKPINIIFHEYFVLYGYLNHIGHRGSGEIVENRMPLEQFFFFFLFFFLHDFEPFVSTRTNYSRPDIRMML